MNRIEEYVHKSFRQIPDSDRKAQLTLDIIQDMEEMVADLIAGGKAEEDAVNKAIIEFGDIGDLKAELAPAAKPFNKHVLGLVYSIIGSFLIMMLVVFVNFYYTPGIIWCVYPIFAVLWWPLTMLFVCLRNK